MSETSENNFNIREKKIILHVFTSLKNELMRRGFFPRLVCRGKLGKVVSWERLQSGYLEVTVQEKLRSGWAGPFVKVEGCCD
jgi:hypothetical protein